MKEIPQEITPLAQDDLFIVRNYENAKFDYPIHCHPEYEINLVICDRGQRTVGENMEEFEGFDLVLSGPYLPHVWNVDCAYNHTVTIQFPSDLLEFSIMSKKFFYPIKQLLEDSRCGLSFSGEDAAEIRDKITALAGTTGFQSALAFFDILNSMAGCSHRRLTDSFNPSLIVRKAKSRRISAVCRHIEEHLSEDVRLSDVAAVANMSESAFSHFFKQHTRIPFKAYLTNARVERACELLASTTITAQEIGYQCGFNNKANFIRIFTKKKGMTPIAYRRYISGLIV